MRIYIAGKYTPTNCTTHEAIKNVHYNLDRAIEAANRIIELGHYPYN